MAKTNMFMCPMFDAFCQPFFKVGALCVEIGECDVKLVKYSLTKMPPEEIAGTSID